jgi:hypothetical protein
MAIGILNTRMLIVQSLTVRKAVMLYTGDLETDNPSSIIRDEEGCRDVQENYRDLSSFTGGCASPKGNSEGLS